jgi:hypothetical protein
VHAPLTLRPASALNHTGFQGLYATLFVNWFFKVHKAIHFIGAIEWQLSSLLVISVTIFLEMSRAVKKPFGAIFASVAVVFIFLIIVTVYMTTPMYIIVVVSNSTLNGTDGIWRIA